MFVKLILLFVLVAFTTGLQAQPDAPDFVSLQAELDANRALWDASKTEAYTMVISRQCFCVVESLGPFTLTVVEDEIVEIEPDNGFGDDLPTVDGVFDQIQQAIVNSVAQLTVTYDPALGYPTTVFIDQDFQIADEEIGYEISVTLINDEEPETTCDAGLVTRRLPFSYRRGKRVPMDLTLAISCRPFSDGDCTCSLSIATTDTS